MIEATINTEPYAALNRANIDAFWRNKEPRCPHCGESCGVSDNDWWKLCEEGEHEVCCPHCDGDFTVITHVHYSFSTEEQPEA